MRVPFFRSLQNGVGSSVMYQAHNLSERFGVPLWTRQPITLQFDTTIRKCPLNCIYCNVQSLFMPENPNSLDLSLSTIEYVCEQLVRLKWRVDYAYAYMNSDPLCDLRLPTINKILKKKLDCNILVSTNGVSYSRRHLLSDSNLNDVRFTISAASPEMYAKVHGKPLFHMALKTLCWLQHNKKWNQHLGVRFIAFKDNLKELPRWKRFFSDMTQEVRPLHFGCDRKTSASLSEGHPFMKVLYGVQQEYFKRKRLPCNCFHNLAVSYDGKIMQCCDLPYEYNWGHVEEVDFEEVWHKRLELGLNHPGCRGCNQKNADWKRLFEEYVWDG